MIRELVSVYPAPQYAEPANSFTSGTNEWSVALGSGGALSSI